MPEDDKSNVAAILDGIAAVLTAIGGLATAVHFDGCKPKPSPDEIDATARELTGTWYSQAVIAYFFVKPND